MTGEQNTKTIVQAGDRPAESKGKRKAKICVREMTFIALM